MPLGTRGSSHCATTVLELTALARTLIGALLGTVHRNTSTTDRPYDMVNLICPSNAKHNLFIGRESYKKVKR